MRISGLYEARRKNAQITRYRIQQALDVKLVSVLERAREAFRMHARIQEGVDDTCWRNKTLNTMENHGKP